MTTMFNDDSAIAVLCEVLDERLRQHKKFGEQNHPSGTGPGVLERIAFRSTSADAARDLCELMFQRKLGTYAHILWEELAEAFEESDEAKVRTELVQVAAVAVAWVEAIDRRRRGP